MSYKKRIAHTPHIPMDIMKQKIKIVNFFSIICLIYSETLNFTGFSIIKTPKLPHRNSAYEYLKPESTS